MMEFKVDKYSHDTLAVFIQPEPGGQWEPISTNWYEPEFANRHMLKLKRINRICSGKPLLRTVLKIERA
ncbi:hypothetical protein TIN2_78 [Tsukamurella phage TIN2]|uniref:Uncharacterized protein n=1 Tax=Tsukamurella phage TIN2 TaxID=1636545 RepID=A0A0K0N5J4_9CAUD|nr:hypothetical protein AVT55_gp045 [Tsukamurella phage TIN2]AKJ71768.1 hypothetical protein TIN2_78 [Tsukamurella phage TIN2]